MYRLMVVDDDEFICRGIVQCIDWSSIGIDEVSMAFDGELALQKMDEDAFVPDVMLVDLCMPFMDGMELCCQIMQKSPRTRIIIVSAYQEFGYAQEAIKMNVEEYLTKPFQDTDVVAAVKRALDKLKQMDNEERLLRESMAIIHQKLTMEWITQGMDSENNRYITDMLGDAFHDRFYCVGILFVSAISVSTGEQSVFDDEAAIRIIMNMIAAEALPSSIQAFAQSNNVVFICQAAEKGKIEPLLVGWVKSMMDRVVSTNACYITFCLGNIYQDAVHANVSYREAKRAGSHRMEFGNGAVVRAWQMEEPILESRCLMPDERERLVECVVQIDREGAKKAVENMFGALKRDNGHSAGRIQLMVLEVLIDLYHQLSNEEEWYAQQLERLTPQFIRLQNVLTHHQACQWLLEAINDTMDELEKRRGSYSESLINTAKQYIQAHYQNPALSLAEVAQHTAISVSYLSMLFRQYMHSSYTAYLTQVRMNHAKLLLEDAKVKLFEIAFQVGFNSQQYFSASFRKHEGCTPSEYRNKMIR